MVAVQYNSIELINTISLWLYKIPRRSRHVVSCSRQSAMSFNSRSARIPFFITAMNVHCRKLPVISFLLNLPEWVCGYFSRFSCAKQFDNISSGEPFPSLQKLFTGLHQPRGKSECMIYFLTNRTCVRNGLRDFSIVLYNLQTGLAEKSSTGFNS
jgi:hypothetical protein